MQYLDDVRAVAVGNDRNEGMSPGGLQVLSAEGDPALGNHLAKSVAHACCFILAAAKDSATAARLMGMAKPATVECTQTVRRTLAKRSGGVAVFQTVQAGMFQADAT